MKPKRFSIHRKHLRYEPDYNTIAEIDFNPKKGGKFRSDVKALVFSESYGGCGLISLGSVEVEIGQWVAVKVGPLSPLIGKVCWVKDLDPEVKKIGIQYQE